MSTPNEHRTRAGYDLFLAAKPGNASDWDENSPLAAVMAPDVKWFDDVDGNPALNPIEDRPAVLVRLEELRREILSCQILSCSETKVVNPVRGEPASLVHTIDHAVKEDANAFGGQRPHFCASSFEFNEAGKVQTVHYCSRQLELHLGPGSGS
jgi:hypothetical protein